MWSRMASAQREVAKGVPNMQENQLEYRNCFEQVTERGETRGG